jgi:hypothetical protein
MTLAIFRCSSSVKVRLARLAPQILEELERRNPMDGKKHARALIINY